MWELVPQSGLKPMLFALEVQSFNYWTLREVPQLELLKCQEAFFDCSPPLLHHPGGPTPWDGLRASFLLPLNTLIPSMLHTLCRTCLLVWIFQSLLSDRM